MKGQESSDGVTPDHCGGGDDNLTTLRANSSIHKFSLDGEWEGGGGDSSHQHNSLTSTLG